MWSIPNKTSNPERALSNLPERDQLFTERLQGMIETTGLPAVTVDGRLTEDALESCVAGKFGLNGRGSGSGPRKAKVAAVPHGSSSKQWQVPW